MRTTYNQFIGERSSGKQLRKCEACKIQTFGENEDCPFCKNQMKGVQDKESTIARKEGVKVQLKKPKPRKKQCATKQ